VGRQPQADHRRDALVLNRVLDPRQVPEQAHDLGHDDVNSRGVGWAAELPLRDDGAAIRRDSRKHHDSRSLPWPPDGTAGTATPSSAAAATTTTAGAAATTTAPSAAGASAGP